MDKAEEGREVAKHSPLPWRVSIDMQPGRSDRVLVRSGKFPVCETFGLEDKEDAALIVRAVNSHAQLTADLAEAVEALRGLHDKTQQYFGIGEVGQTWPKFFDGAMSNARSILNKHGKEAK